jgi:hypothetical protein
MSKRKRKPKTIIVIPQRTEEITPGDVIHAANQIGRAIGAVRDAIEAAKPIVKHVMKRRTK